MKVELAKLFFKRAKADLITAKAALEKKVYADAVYHAEQSVQKAQKAALLLKGIEVEEHRVASIFYDEIVLHYPELERVFDIAVELEKHWLKPRYPLRRGKRLFDPLSYYNQRIARKAVRDAERFLKAIERFLRRRFALALD